MWLCYDIASYSVKDFMVMDPAIMWLLYLPLCAVRVGRGLGKREGWVWYGRTYCKTSHDFCRHEVQVTVGDSDSIYGI
eukprot:scaffold7460_cov64-Cyclotella_meneghiniana.AAC.4